LPRDAYFGIADPGPHARDAVRGSRARSGEPGEASDAGQKSQEHLINILLACSTREEELRAERIAVMTSQQISGEERLRLLAFPKPRVCSTPIAKRRPRRCSRSS
jgi:hypothetical protein